MGNFRISIWRAFAFQSYQPFLYAQDNVYQYKDEMVKIIAKVVNETKDDIFTKYNQTKEDITFFVSMTDDELAEELENESVALMTNHKLVPEFLARYDAES